MPERLFRLRVEYEGTAYSGFQRQPAEGPPSVQAALEAALSRLVAHPVRVLGAGRTDAGVHATGQVISFRTTADRSPRVIQRGANALLPPDIRVLEAVVAEEGFHPRFSALSRTYEYLILQDPRPDTLLLRRAWQVAEPLDVERMRSAGALLLGSHDFTTYSARVPDDEPRVRTLQEFAVERWEPGGPGPLARLAATVVVRVRADSFLRRMVRMLTGALVKVGRGEWAVDEPRRALEARDPGAAPPPAPPWGLYLVDVEYPRPVWE